MTDTIALRRWQRLRYRLLLQIRALLNLVEQLGLVGGGVVIGVWVNALSAPDASSIVDVTVGIFDVRSNPSAWVTAAAALLFVARYAVPWLQRKVVGSTDQTIMLSRHFENAVDPAIRAFHAGRIAWGTQLTLQTCPNIEDGWAPEAVSLQKEPSEFRFADPAEEGEYERWLQDQDPKRVSGAGFRLTLDPTSFTDAPDLVLRIQPIRHAYVRYYQERRAVLEPVRRAAIEAVIATQRIDFPHKLSMHTVVATNDGYVLLTQRSMKVEYHPGKWSCSIEEQIRPEDVREPDSNGMRKWASRMLAEELGLGEEERSGAHTRFLAVFLEADILNVAIAALVTLDVTRQRLDATLRTKPRMDYEFQAWDFIKWDRLAPELLRPSKDYHPSSGLRMLLAGIAHFGVHSFELRLRSQAFGAL